MKLNLKRLFLLVSLFSVNAFAQVNADPSRPTIFSDSTSVQTVPMQNSSGKQVLETVVVPGDDAVIKWAGGIISGTGIKYFSVSNKITATSLRVEYAPGTVNQASGGKSQGKSAGNTKDASGVRPVCTVDTCGTCWTPAACNFSVIDGHLWNGGYQVPGDQYTILDANGNPLQIVTVENGGLNFQPASGGTGSGGGDGGGDGGGGGGGTGGGGTGDGGDCGDDDGQQPCEGDNAVHRKP